MACALLRPKTVLVVVIMHVLDTAIAASMRIWRKGSSLANVAGKARQRTCIVCRESNTKSNLLRVVRTPEGAVVFDSTGRMNGRGAYVCSVACLDKAIKTKRLDSALRTKLTEEDCERIAQQLREALSNEDK